MSDSVVRIAVAGVGGWGKNVLRAFGLAAGARVSAICDPDPGRLAAAKESFPSAEMASDLEPFLGRADIDAVVLATPAETHYPMARWALECGKHVFVEKPLALSSSHAGDLVTLADRNGLKLMVGHLLEYHPAIQHMKTAIDSGALGDVLYIASRRLNLGVVRSTENAFWSLAPHDVSVALYLLGEEPGSVAAQGVCCLQPGIEDVVVATLVFPGGRMAHIHVSWLDPRKVREIVVVGSRGMLVFDEMAAHKLVFHDKHASLAEGRVSLHKGETKASDLPHTPPLDIEAQHFVDAIRFDRTPRSDGHDGLRVVRVLEKVEQALSGARKGERS